MQYTKDIILKHVRLHGSHSVIGSNVRNNQSLVIVLPEGKQSLSNLIKHGFSNTIRFDRALKIAGDKDYPTYRAEWATHLKTQGKDRDMFIPAANIKLVSKTSNRGRWYYDDIRSTEDLVDALKNNDSKIQAFVTAIRTDLSELVENLQDVQRIASEMINRSQSESYTPKLIVRGINRATGDTAAEEILFVRSKNTQGVSGVDVNSTMDAIATSNSLCRLLSAESREKGVLVEVIPAVHVNMSSMSTSALIDKKLMRRNRNNELGIADWHFRVFSSQGSDSFSPCLLTIGTSPTDDRFHFAKSLDSIGETDERWHMGNIPTRNWNSSALEKIKEHENSIVAEKTNSFGPGY